MQGRNKKPSRHKNIVQYIANKYIVNSRKFTFYCNKVIDAHECNTRQTARNDGSLQLSSPCHSRGYCSPLQLPSQYKSCPTRLLFPPAMLGKTPVMAQFSVRFGDSFCVQNVTNHGKSKCYSRCSISVTYIKLTHFIQYLMCLVYDIQYNVKECSV